MATRVPSQQCQNGLVLREVACWQGIAGVAASQAAGRTYTARFQTVGCKAAANFREGYGMVSRYLHRPVQIGSLAMAAATQAIGAALSAR
jgi:hypothetical protein